MCPGGAVGAWWLADGSPLIAPLPQPVLRTAGT